MLGAFGNAWGVSASWSRSLRYTPSRYCSRSFLTGTDSDLAIALLNMFTLCSSLFTRASKRWLFGSPIYDEAQLMLSPYLQEE